MYVNSFQCFDIPYCAFDFLSLPGRSDNGEPGYTNYFHDAIVDWYTELCSGRRCRIGVRHDSIRVEVSIKYNTPIRPA